MFAAALVGTVARDGLDEKQFVVEGDLSKPSAAIESPTEMLNDLVFLSKPDNLNSDTRHSRSHANAIDIRHEHQVLRKILSIALLGSNLKTQQCTQRVWQSLHY